MSFKTMDDGQILLYAVSVIYHHFVYGQWSLRPSYWESLYILLKIHLGLLVCHMFHDPLAHFITLKYKCAHTHPHTHIVVCNMHKC